MTESEERAYIEGRRAAARDQLRHCIREMLGDGADDDPLVALARKVVSLDEARAALRKVCAEHGDNDWPDNLSLADVIEKHLARHLNCDHCGEPMGKRCATCENDE